MGNRARRFRYDRESTITRRIYNRRLRRQEARAVERGDDALPRRRGTQGWLTW